MKLATQGVLGNDLFTGYYVGQMKSAGARFDLLDPAFYLRNTLTAAGPISAGWAIQSVREL